MSSILNSALQNRCSSPSPVENSRRDLAGLLGSRWAQATSSTTTATATATPTAATATTSGGSTHRSRYVQRRVQQHCDEQPHGEQPETSMSADLEQPIHQPPAADASADSGKASPAISPAGSPDFDIVTGDTPVSRSARCTARRKAAAAIAVVVTAVLALLVFVVYSGSSAAHAGEALFTVPMTTNVVLVGGVCTGSFTTTMYIGAGCAVPETECGPDDVNLPADGSACARGDVTNVTRTVE